MKVTKKTKVNRVIAMLLAIMILFLGTFEIKAATGSKVYLFGLHSDDTLQNCGVHCSWMNSVGKMYKNHDSAATIVKRHYRSKKNLYNGMKNANYLMILTHGTPTSILSYNTEGVKSSVTIDNIMKGNELSQLKVCLLTACNASKVARAMHEKGAKTTIGFTTQIYPSAANKMQLYFNKYFTSGQTVSVAINNAYRSTRNDLGDDRGAKNYAIFGNTAQKF